MYNAFKMIQNTVETEEMLISLDDDFTLLDCLSTCHVKLRNEYLYYESGRLKEGISEQIKIKDLFSCSVIKQQTKCHLKFNVDLKLISYPLVKGQRHRRQHAFRINKSTNWEENFKIAQKWKDFILEAMYNIPGGFKSTENYENIRTTRPLFGSKEIEKKLIVYVNPKSGTGISEKIYKNHVKPMLADAGIQHTVVMTKDRFAAYNSVQTLDLTKCTGLVVISGDGLLYEIYNGLLHRKDWYDAISFPVSVIPGGTGNGLATSLGYVLSEPYIKNPVLVSTLNILNPIITPMDLVIVNTLCKKRLLSFLSISIGFLADVDIESERLRAIGESRFIIWSMKRLLDLRTYRCRLSYKIAGKKKSQRKYCTPVKYQPMSNKKHILSNECNGVTLRGIQSINTPSAMTIQNSMLNNDSILQEDDDEFYPDYAKILVDKSFTDPDFDVLGQPVPSNWQVIEEDFIFIFAAFKPFIGKDGFISPLSSLSDGVMYLWMMKKGVSRRAVLNFLLSISHGPEPNEHVQRIPVTAFRIEPLTTDGNLVVDGESIDYGPIQAAVLPGKGSLMSKPI